MVRATRKTQREGKRVGRIRKPTEMSLEAWQIALRKQFAQEQIFRIKNIGAEPIFSEFHVTNPQTRRTYRVAIRGAGLGENYCSCPDFAVNTLGTCKHVEFLLARLKRKRGAAAAFRAGYRPPFSEVFLRYGAKREVVFSAGTECPASLETAARRYFGPDGVLKADAYRHLHLFLKKANESDHEVRFYDDTMDFIAQVRDAEELAKRIDKAFPPGAAAALDRMLKVPLYPYQRQGALFAARAGRCLIADDMGLGKTIEAIAAAEILARTAGIERVLIISPTSLKHQWQREIDKFAPRPTLVIEGLQPKRAEMYAAEAFYKITNYDVVRRDVDLIAGWQPDLIVLDEAQRIKNWKTKTARNVKQLPSQYAFVLTGTPLENRLEELHSIVEFVDRFRLGPTFRFLDRHQVADEHGKVVGYRDLSAISETLKPILIRRTKDAVLKELPQRLDKRFFVPMTDEQKQHHAENHQTVFRIVAKWRRRGFLSEIDQRRLMIALQNMRMSCNSTYLLDKETDHGHKADELMSLLSDILEEPGAKAVVFSQWVRMHELIIRRLAGRKWDHAFLHGGVPGRNRKGLIQRFRDDPACRLFLSTDAGGVGLNLQNASVVVNMDQPWNPAVLEQRIGRVHRLGQRRPVRVIHFIAKGTIEEGMLSLLAFKKSMFTGVLDGGKDEVFLGGTRLTRFMESVEQAAGEIPPAAAPPAAPAEPPPSRPAAAAAASQQQALADVLAAGATLLGKLSEALTAPAAKPGAAGGLIERDEKTGRPYLKLPLPEGEALQNLAKMFSAFLTPGR